MLQSESQKTSPDKRTIANLMCWTYPFRRQEILEKGMEIANILKIYPPLKKLTRYTELKHHRIAYSILSFNFQIYSEFNRIFD